MLAYELSGKFSCLGCGDNRNCIHCMKPFGRSKEMTSSQKAARQKEIDLANSKLSTEYIKQRLKNAKKGAEYLAWSTILENRQSMERKNAEQPGAYAATLAKKKADDAAALKAAFTIPRAVRIGVTQALVDVASVVKPLTPIISLFVPGLNTIVNVASNVIDTAAKSDNVTVSKNASEIANITGTVAHIAPIAINVLANAGALKDLPAQAQDDLKKIGTLDKTKGDLLAIANQEVLPRLPGAVDQLSKIISSDTKNPIIEQIKNNPVSTVIENVKKDMEQKRSVLCQRGDYKSLEAIDNEIKNLEKNLKPQLDLIKSISEVKDINRKIGNVISIVAKDIQNKILPEDKIPGKTIYDDIVKLRNDLIKKGTPLILIDEKLSNLKEDDRALSCLKNAQNKKLYYVDNGELRECN